MERLLATVNQDPKEAQVYLRATPDGALLVASVDVAGADRELQSTRYTVKAAWTGAALGDAVRQTVALDVSGTSMTRISVLWENENTGATISAPPSVAAYLTPLNGGESLTLSQLLSAGLATSYNQVASLGYLADLAAANDPFASYRLAQSEDINGTAYIFKTNGVAWLLTRVVSTTTSDTATYAGPGNNPSTTIANAWAQRTLLVYGSIGGA